MRCDIVLPGGARPLPECKCIQVDKVELSPRIDLYTLTSAYSRVPGGARRCPAVPGGARRYLAVPIEPLD